MYEARNPAPAFHPACISTIALQALRGPGNCPKKQSLAIRGLYKGYIFYLQKQALEQPVRRVFTPPEI